MYNPDFAGPRISFSGDFSLEPPRASSSAPALGGGDPDFEFGGHGAGGQAMMAAADQLFSKGRIVPLKDRAPAMSAVGGNLTTLRDELRTHSAAAGEHPRARPSGIRWKELLGLRRPPSDKRRERPAAAADVDAGEDLL